jgi:hypothetical protein
MNQQVHENAYRAAFDFATSELREILEKFDQLRARKERIEKLVAALESIVAPDESIDSKPQAAVQDPAVKNAESSFDSSEELEGPMSDPFQRRIDQVLGIGVGRRDSRKFSRRF